MQTAAAAVSAPEDEGEPILARWILRLRWALFASLALMLPFAEHLLGYHVMYAIAIPIIVAAVLKDVALRRAGWPLPLAASVAIDQLAIAGVLASAGGAGNPMSALFFVHVALAASLLPRRTTFALAALGAGAFATLFLLPAGACCPAHPANGAFSAHLYGMWLAFVLCAALVAFFLTQVRTALEERAREIAELRRRGEASARFAALGALAAGTAHELGTPLGTIAVLAGEIEDRAGDAASCARSIGAEVRRCRDVIAKMRGGGEPLEGERTSPLRGAVEEAVASWCVAHPDAKVAYANRGDGEGNVALARSEIATAVHALLDNAYQATVAAGASDAIDVVVDASAGEARIEVGDSGEGVPVELLPRVGEPFVTTKDPGEGMGLGLYLVRRLLEEVGGTLELRPRARGTLVAIRLDQLTAEG